jgi:hypothetical protein
MIPLTFREITNMLPFVGNLDTSRLEVSLKHVPVLVHNGFAELVDDMLGFFIAHSGCLCISIALDCSFSVSFCLLSTRESVA